MKKLDVDLSEVALAMDRGPDDPLELVLNPETGALTWAGLEDEDPDDVEGERVPRLETRDSFRIMERFLEVVSDPDDRALLDQALAGKGAFRRFRDVVNRQPALRDAWHAFHEAALRKHATEWLNGLGIDPRDTSPPPPPPPPPAPPPPAQLTFVDLLLFGEGTRELVGGRVRRTLTSKDARRHFKTVARSICEHWGEPWRNRLIEGSNAFERGRFRLTLQGDVLELTVEVSADVLRFMPAASGKLP